MRCMGPLLLPGVDLEEPPREWGVEYEWIEWRDRGPVLFGPSMLLRLQKSSRLSLIAACVFESVPTAPERRSADEEVWLNKRENTTSAEAIHVNSSTQHQQQQRTTSAAHISSTQRQQHTTSAAHNARITQHQQQQHTTSAAAGVTERIRVTKTIHLSMSIST